MELNTFKKRVYSFWNQKPCGTKEVDFQFGTKEFFERLEFLRYERESFIKDFAKFEERKGLKILEVGVGAGTDFINFVRAGADATGVDFTDSSIEIVKQRLFLEKLKADVNKADAENLPYKDNTFDFVYSWGCIHHTENTSKAANEIKRVLKSGGEYVVMIYHRYSLVVLQAYIVYGLLKFKPFKSLDEIVSENLESYGTKIYTKQQLRDMFFGEKTKITTVLTPYDVRIGRNRFLPKVLRKFIPDSLGYFIVAQGKKQ